ncbi:MAG TPA: hypothetical protein VHV30_02990 [Polyangiaceae bacterium]|jgi:hypothetical protein|nr:hypothetical protein [Polyangiaceae bacterium]
MACAPVLAPVGLADSSRPPRRPRADTEAAAGRPAPGDTPARSARCGGCSASYDAPAWQALPRVATLTGEAIARNVVKWPEGVHIEIRRCSRCGRSIARTTEGG